MKNYKAIIFDIDGTLLNTLDMNMYPLMQIIREELGEEWTFQQVLRFSSQPGLKTMDDLGIKDKETTYARWVRYVNEYQPGAVVYDGILEVLAKFARAGIRMAAASAKMHKQYQIDVVDKGIDRYLETAVLAEDTVRHKPDPDPIWEALRRMDLKPEDVIFIGDAILDYVAAGHAGVDFGYARWGSVSAAGIESPDLVFDRPEDMLVLLENL